MENNLYLSRFWTRGWALLIDVIILGIFGFILGLTFKSFFISLGENAKIIGWLISLAYFTMLNSKINNGQTFGKKVMNIQVVDIYGNAVSLKASFVRAFILTTPFFLNGYSIPGAALFSVITTIQSTVVFTFSIGIILFYIINKETRQSIHDIIAKTYVAQVYRNDEVTLMPKIRKLSFYALTVLFLIGSAFTIYDFETDPKISKLIPVYENILKQGNVSEVSVFMNFEPSTDSTRTNRYAYTVTIKPTKYIEKSSRAEEYISRPEFKQTVETFINSKVYETDNDMLSVVVDSGFDIGIASQTSSFGIGKSIYEWKKIYSL
ncbi:RDD family protein [Polluticoccus soli]|uniref:RDD family protein n=1 Tax=Polluticoccus soli TaxID=3034150 RepID=UPI0023E2F407|nr:RDD family protein [Flavipsychrobacter sp. JY13-12]